MDYITNFLTSRRLNVTGPSLVGNFILQPSGKLTFTTIQMLISAHVFHSSNMCAANTHVSCVEILKLS